MEQLKWKLKTLCVFRDLLQDPVIAALLDYLETPSAPAYAAFVSVLYEANGGDLAAHIQELCENSSNVYVRTLGRGEEAPDHMVCALLSELETLQETAELTREKLCGCLECKGFLPDFVGTKWNLKEQYLQRTANIEKYGFGVYAKHHMFRVDEHDQIVPVLHPDGTRLSQLVDYQRERGIVLDNAKALLMGKPASNILLTGDAGTGKSSTVKAVVNELRRDGLRLIEIRKDQLGAIPKLLDELSDNPLKFVLFIDDLSFLKDDDNFNALKAVLEGSVTAKSPNVVIYATSNRRHIIKEKFSDREGDDIHRNDTMQELISLSERFGIHVSFSKPNRETYLRIVRHLAQEKGLQIPETELDAQAERLALERGGRSARLARQFIDGLLSMQKL